MSKCGAFAACLFALVFRLAASARSSTLGSGRTCEGTLIITMGSEGMSAVKASLKVSMKGKAATFSLKNKFATPLKGSGRVSSEQATLWMLEGKDDSERAFSGSFRVIEASYASDTRHYGILELKMGKVSIHGPMSCTSK